MLNIPNTISLIRIIFALFLFYFAWNNNPLIFLILFIIALLTDTFDGYLARKLGQTTKLGEKLDSWGDFILYLTVPTCAWWLWPELVIQELLFIIIALTSFLIPILIGFLKYKRLTSYHTWAAKLSAVLLGVSTPLLFIGGPSWPFRISAVVFLLAELEETSITTVLPSWHSNVPSFWHAIKIAQSKKKLDYKT